ncbi:DNA-directed RNA polymerase subunit beta [Mycoplasma testudineum]|uniref:DNA-directed RNA polymerase subunit beta n=2 Tax=Mycoplasma testudineum TaxID=244584 RepID=A0A4R6IFK8_9MOLU|nr:DNA-directed RNA polymerase subunit beta [Mycoplasma testudineum]OYD27018.1 DNA-directed RNA polymerase subunit beta [Mycoplasma testudineum]TDO20566.1 DNA-directed RNA polymerase subunit beta [Mycoplasma testudineum]
MSNSKFVDRKFGPITVRRDYSKTKNSLPLTDVLEMQRTSFDEFLNKSIDKALKAIYPIESGNKKVVISYINGSKKIEKPALSEVKAIKEAKERGATYSAKVRIKLQKMINETGETTTDEVLLCDIPLMTQGGSFIINGSEKIIVSQLIRSPGVYFSTRTRDKQSDDLFNKVDLLPRIGSWVEIKHKVSGSSVDSVKIRIDKNKQFSLSTFLVSLGLTHEDIIKLYGNSETLMQTLQKDKFKFDEQDETTILKEARERIFRIIRKGDRITKEAVRNLIPNLIFNEKRYSLSDSGRFIINRKLTLIDRIIGTYLAEDLIGKVDGEKRVIFKEGTYINKEIAHQIQNGFESKLFPWINLANETSLNEDAYGRLVEDSPELKKRLRVIGVRVFKNKKDKDENGLKHLIIGNDPSATEGHLLVSDIIAAVGYYFNLIENIGVEDDPDSLINKRIVSVGELLLNQFTIGLTKMEKNTKEKISSKDSSKITPKNVTNNKMIQNQIKTFFNSSKLSQFMDQTNPLAEISTKRKITSLGMGGLNRDTAQFEVRDVHSTHYGRICPIETPEGQNIGLILNLATYARINDLGFLETPYYKVNNAVVDYSTPIYLTAYQEQDKKFAQSTIDIDKNNRIVEKQITVKFNGDYTIVDAEEVDYISVSSNQMTSLASSCIPFLENNDANRALMGANMQRQAVPLLKAEAPFVATGIEADIAKFSSSNVKANRAGEVIYVDGNEIKISPHAEGDTKTRTDVYPLMSFQRSNQGTVMSQSPIVKVGDHVEAGDIITDSSSFSNAEMSIGKNLLVGFTTFEGYNFEDAVIISERLFKDDSLTSIHIEEQSIQFRKSKAGDDELTDQIPNASSNSRRHLDDTGIVLVGSEVKPGDILVGRVSPRGDENNNPSEKLLHAIFNQKISAKKDTSLKVKNGHQGTVIDVQILSRENGDKLEDGIDKIIKVYIAQKRKIKVGDKMAGRFGNKGVISRIVPVEDMPYLEDGTPLDILLNPQGVPSRMNIGQILELHLGMVSYKTGVKFVSPVFDGIKWDVIQEELQKAGLDKSGKSVVYDPQTAKPFDNPISVGVMYMLKLSHMVDDKMHARSVGPYSLITQQPLGGKSQNGGQRFGEMETWALESYGATNILQEILTYKSDNIEGRNQLYGALTSGKELPEPGVPESFSVLAYELRGLGVKFEVHEDEFEYSNADEDSDNEIGEVDDYDDVEFEDLDIDMSDDIESFN